MLSITLNPVCARTLKLVSTEGAASHARDVIREWLGLMHPALFETQLVISELVTNAYRYALGHNEILVGMPFIQPESCKVTVTDGGNPESMPRMFIKPNLEIEGHRGLRIVNDYSRSDWGTYLLSDRGPRVVWAWVFPSMPFRG